MNSTRYFLLTFFINYYFYKFEVPGAMWPSSKSPASRHHYYYNNVLGESLTIVCGLPNPYKINSVERSRFPGLPRSSLSTEYRASISFFFLSPLVFFLYHHESLYNNFFFIFEYMSFKLSPLLFFFFCRKVSIIMIMRNHLKKWCFFYFFYLFPLCCNTKEVINGKMVHFIIRI